MNDYAERANGEVQLSLRGVLDNIEFSLNNAHDSMSELEDRLIGPSPKPMPGPAQSNAAPAPHPGVRVAAETLAARADSLVARMQKLASTL